MDDKILYFGFGSNLKRLRLQINCPSAQFLCKAELKDYKLVFAGSSKFWGGGTATIRPSPGDRVWGAVWELDPKDLPSLDIQEGAHLGIYEKMSVTVTSDEGDSKVVDTYARPENIEVTPPSPQYLKVVLEGATECGLPQNYIEELKKIEHNGYAGRVVLAEDYVLEQ